METLPAGVRFGGDFTILRVLGAGGMATVYEAREEPIGRLVALKVLDRAEPALRARFLAEARTMAGLRHPGVAEILRFGTDPATGLPFLAMKPYPGSLADRLGDSRALAEVDAAALGLRLADALAALHAADPPVVHRDVKPSNVLLDETGAPVLADFGVAKRFAPEETLHTLSSAGTQPGTWFYAAPEQRAGLPLSPAADWYAFGVLLYRCLTGGFPPPGGALPVDVTAETSRAWRPLLRGLLRADPATRLADPDAVRAALRRVLRSCRRRAFVRRFRVPLALLSLAVCSAVAIRLAAPKNAAPANDPSAESGSTTGRFLQWDYSERKHEFNLRPEMPWRPPAPLQRLKDLVQDYPNPSDGDVPIVDETGCIRVPSWHRLYFGDLPTNHPPPAIVLDGGTFVFGPSPKDQRAFRQRLVDLWESRRDGELGFDELRALLDTRPQVSNVLANVVLIGPNGGRIVDSWWYRYPDWDLSSPVPRFFAPIRAEENAGKLGVRGRRILFDRDLLDPAVRFVNNYRTCVYDSDGTPRDIREHFAK